MELVRKWNLWENLLLPCLLCLFLFNISTIWQVYTCVYWILLFPPIHYYLILLLVLLKSFFTQHVPFYFGGSNCVIFSPFYPVSVIMVASIKDVFKYFGCKCIMKYVCVFSSDSFVCVQFLWFYLKHPQGSLQPFLIPVPEATLSGSLLGTNLYLVHL